MFFSFLIACHLKVVFQPQADVIVFGVSVAFFTREFAKKTKILGELPVHVNTVIRACSCEIISFYGLFNVINTRITNCLIASQEFMFYATDQTNLKIATV